MSEDFDYAYDLMIARDTQKMMGMVGVLLDFSYVDELIEHMKSMDIENKAIYNSYLRATKEIDRLHKALLDLAEGGYGDNVEDAYDNLVERARKNVKEDPYYEWE